MSIRKYQDPVKSVKLSDIRKHVTSNGGEYEKLRIRLNGMDAYEVNGVTYSKNQLKEAFAMGLL